MWLGVNPGCAGAVAAIGDDGRPVDFLLMPTIKPGKASRREWVSRWWGL